MSERRGFNYKKWVRITGFVIIPVILVGGMLVYGRMYGIRQALQELVRSESDNRYSLSIGHTEINVSSLSFKFEDVKITRAAGDTTSGVAFAEVPEIGLRFGSIRSLFSKEMDISLLSAVEPKITILSGRRRVERSMITKQVMELYPVIEAILAGFNIQTLKVTAATLHFIQRDKDVFSIRLVDLDIKDWRMRELSNTSQLRISIQKQKLNLGKANLNVSGIEYSYLQRHLVFTDFSVSASDSASGSNVAVSGKALKLNNLDYRELYNNLRYNLKRAEIVEPVIHATFQWKKGKRSRAINRDIVTRLVKQSIGECELDSAVISKARVHIELRHGDDTVRIDLPRVDFRLHTFAVMKDSANFRIGEMQVNLNRSALSMPGNWAVELDEVLYDRHRDLTLRNITIRKTLQPTPIATLATLRIGYFNVIALLLEKRFSASTIHAEGGYVNVHHFARNATGADSSLRAPDMVVNSLSLKDIDLTYRTTKTSMEVQGLSLGATNVRTDNRGNIRYQVKNVSARLAMVRIPNLGIQATMNDVAFNGETLNASVVKAVKDSLTVVANNFETRLSGTIHKVKSFKYISADRLSLTGRVPRFRSSSVRQGSEPVVLERLNIATLHANLINNTATIAFDAKNIRTDQFTFGHAIRWPRHASGELSSVSMKTPHMDTRATSILVDYPRRLTATGIQLSGPQYRAAVATAVIRRPGYQQNWTIDRLLLTDVQLSLDSRRLDADSITATSALFVAGGPYADRIDVYKPIVAFGSSADSGEAPKGRLLDLLPAHHLYVHPGNITMADSHKVVFGLVHADRDKQVVRASYISTSLKKSELTVRNIAVQPGRITFDSILLIPNRKWYSNLEVEETQIQMRLGRVTVREVFLDRYVQHRAVENLDVQIGYADLDLRRNKLLPDPPPLGKPVTLDGLIALPANVQISKIDIRDGRLQYRQISDKTGEEGYIMMDKIVATSRFDSLSSFISLRAKTSLYQSGMVELDYKTVANDKFRLDIQVRDMELTKLNQIIMPLQSIRIKSGYLKEYKLSVDADDDAATGDAAISYDGLHLEIFKHDEPERKSLGSEVLTLLADGLILKHSRDNAHSSVSHARIKHKSVFHYWVTSAIEGATGAIRKGKKEKKSKAQHRRT